MFTIGEFSRATHLSVKALRHYDELGLLEPADVDPSSGYRRYQAAQVPSAHLIKRLRDLEMPLPEIREVLAAPDPATRDSAIAAHLERMEATLARTQDTVAALRSILTRRVGPDVERRIVPALPVALVRAEVAWDDTEAWLTEALAGLHARVEATGPDGAVYDLAFFEDHVGEVTAFVPVASSSEVLPGGAFAVAVHHGPFDRLDETYGVLGSHVTALGIDGEGPIREHYLADDVTEVLWPVERAAGGSSRHL